MTFITQTDGSNATIVSNENGNISLTHMVDKNAPQGFTRMAAGVRKSNGTIESYVGKFLFSMDVTFKDNVYVSRVGAMITNSGFSVISGDDQAKLLGREGSYSEAKADRTFEAGVTYRFVYSMETTDDTQLIQLWGCSNRTTITYSNFHLIPMTGAAGKVSSTFLYFGKTGMSDNEFHVDPTPDPDPVKKNVLMPNGQNFFDAANWSKSIKGQGEVGDDIYENDGSLSFTKDTAARINLFHVMGSDNKTLVHVADNGSKKDALLSNVYNTEYSYSLDMLVNGTFDMGLLAAANAFSKADTAQPAFYLSFAEDGSVSMSQGSSADATSIFTDHFSVPAGSYEQGKKFTFTIKLHRTDKETLKAQLLVNGTLLKFTGDAITTETGYSYSFDENGVFTSSKYLANVGMGQRLSVLPTGDTSKVTISDLKIETKTIEAPAEPETPIDALEVSNPYTMYNGKDLFTASNWTAASKDAAARNEETIKDSNGSLSFTKDTPSRIDFFYVAKSGTNWRHLGDKKANIAGLDILDKDYRFDLDVSSTGAFDLMMLGNKTAFDKSDKNNAFYLSAADDGTLSLIFCYSQNSVSTFTSTAKFDFTKKQRISIVMNRTNESDIDISIYLDYLQVKFSGESTTPNADSTLSVDNKGKATLAGLLTNVGLGQRFGVMPGDSSTVKISGAAFLPAPATK